MGRKADDEVGSKKARIQTGFAGRAPAPLQHRQKGRDSLSSTSRQTSVVCRVARPKAAMRVASSRQKRWRYQLAVKSYVQQWVTAIAHWWHSLVAF